ncbi:hypothetical protein [Arthrobacter sp. D1-17]
MAASPPNGSVHHPHGRRRASATRLGRSLFERRNVAAAVAVLLTATGVGSAVAATQVTQTNPGGIIAVGPVNSAYGFPSWYEDKNHTRLELCLEAQNPLCGFLPGDVPNEAAEISFPDNFPDEAFYMLAGSELELPNGGQAVLVLGLEAAFSNSVTDGDQVVFGRQRIVVKGGPANQTLTFQHPYGTITIDTDGAGDGKLVEDISPAIGNFTTALKSNIGPFLKWDTGAPEGYLGDPNQDHTVTGSPFGYNKFSVSGGGLNVETDQFSLMGKIATNSGVSADSAVLNGGMIDVFASSSNSAQLQVEGQDGKFKLTPMVTDPDSGRYYARIQFTGDAPTSVKITNIADKPASSSTINVSKPSGISITKAVFDGSKLEVAATSSVGYPLEVVGLGTLEAPATEGAPAEASIPVKAPPATITVKHDAGNAATLAVTVAGGSATEPGLDPLTPAPDSGPVTETGPGGGSTGGTEPLTAAVTASSTTAARGTSVQLDGSSSTGEVGYQWSQVTGPTVTLSSTTAPNPTVAVPLWASTQDSAPKAPPTQGPARIKLVTTGADGTTKEAWVDLTIQNDSVTIDAGSRHRRGSELRISGTSTLAGNTAILTPATSIVVWDVSNAATPVKIGTAQVDTLGAWSYKIKPGPAQQVTRVMVQSSRGGSATASIASR